MTVLISPADVTEDLTAGDAQHFIRSLSDAQLEKLADLLTAALTLARNEICMRQVRTWEGAK